MLHSERMGDRSQIRLVVGSGSSFSSVGRRSCAVSSRFGVAGRGICTIELRTRPAGVDETVAIVEDNAPEPDKQHFKSGWV